MPIKVTCPKCSGVLHAPDDAGGKRGKCPTCGTVLAIPVATAEPAGMSVPAPSRLPTPTRLPEPARPSAIDQDARRSSFGVLTDPPVAPPKPARGSFSGESRSGDPFVKPAPKPASGPATDSEARGYRALRRGLSSVGFSITLFLLAVLTYLVVPLLPKFGVPLPEKSPGFLRQENLSTTTEIGLLLPVVLAALGLLFMLLGRSSAGSAPRASGARGTFKLATLFTFLTVMGLVAYTVMAVLAVLEGAPAGALLPVDETSGIAQRAGLATAAVFAPLAELLFWVGLARLGAGLGDARLTARVTRYFLYAGLVYAVAGLSVYAVSWYGRDVEAFIAQNVTPQLQNLGEFEQYLPQAAIAVVALSAWLIYTRAMSAGRRAARVWLERHA